MAAGHAVKGQACPATVGAADLDTGKMLDLGRIALLHRQLVALGSQLLHIVLQLG